MRCALSIGTVKIHDRNLQIHATETDKVYHNHSPLIMVIFFHASLLSTISEILTVYDMVLIHYLI